jgi:hypothetical protein
MPVILRFITAISLTLALVGCGDKDEKPCDEIAATVCEIDSESTDCSKWSDYAEEVHADEEAQDACQAELDAFRGGDETGTLPNTAPIAVDDSAQTWLEMAVEIAVLDNDSDPDSDTIAITEVTQPDDGFVAINTSGTGSLTYTPTGAFTGVDTFTYTIIDGNGGSDSATVAVNVTDAPTLVITLPDEGAEVTGSEVTIAFEVNGCNVSSPSADPGGCHLHKYLDGASYNNTDGTGFGHYSPAAFTISPVSEGEHSFMLYLIANDGSDAPFDPLISDTVTFTVTASDTGSSGDDTGLSSKQ